MTIYHETPVCPLCHSRRTGYFITGLVDDPKKTKKALKHGEFIDFVPPEMLHEYNCFCVECDARWRADIKFRIINRKQLEEIKNKKEITDQLLDSLNDQYLKWRNDYIKEQSQQSVLSKIAKKTGQFIHDTIGFN